MNRRELLKTAASSLALPLLAGRSPEVLAGNAPRILVVVELNGGNDGLNTVIPYRDPSYPRLRPNLAIPPERVIRLSEQEGLHPGLEPLMACWQAGEWAIVRGLGYSPANRSHFRSIEIWDNAAPTDSSAREGWLGRLFADHPERSRVDALVLGRAHFGPVAGDRARVLTLQDRGDLEHQSPPLPATSDLPANRALRHVIEVEADLRAATEAVRASVERADPIEADFPRGDFARQLATCTMLIAAGAPVLVYKLSLGGFDTHRNEPAAHERLLGELAQGLARFREVLMERRLWSQVLVMTYSEFGRRAVENTSRGTDHGTAAPQFLLGGAVEGGLYGQSPRLDDLDGGDLRHTMDFRRLYATVARRWWGIADPGDRLRAHRPLECIRAA